MLVPAFIIQPLVENAVRHGMRDEGPLNITCAPPRPRDDIVDIEVIDDGVGMDDAAKARLLDTHGSSSATERSAAPQGGGTGVAMHNILKRIERF